jgi:CheY-like chemotaxis protein
MIPRLEEGILRLTIITAREFAQDGKLADGYTCLLEGLHRAETAVAQGQPWGPWLAVRYSEAMETYVRRYGVPIEDLSAEAVPDPSGEELESAAGEKPVLIVEDDPGLRSTLTEVLQEEGYAVVAAKDGAEALERLRSGLPVSVIVLDLMMPGMDGWEFRQQQKDDPVLASVPVLVITALGCDTSAAASLDVAGYFRKPLDLDALLACIDHHYH